MAEVFGRWQKRRQKLEARKDFLSKLNRIVPWDKFRRCLEQLATQERKSKAGRKPIDPLLLFKLLIVQQRYIAVNKYVRTL
jgi:hypothetical protein